MSELAAPGPTDPASGQPDHHAEVGALKAWLRQNAVSLVVSALVVALVCKYLDPLDTLQVAFGLGFIIFLHELGHFLAAKWCDVHVKTFSIGFGPAVPFCSYKWGETTYMLGIIPLGGYVSMVGEGTGESTPDGDPDDDDDDPRSFKNKSVGRRMVIISAGVVMNVVLGLAFFMAAYLHGVREEPAVAGTVFPGGAAYRGDMRTGDRIIEIDGLQNPTFKDIPPVVMSTRKGVPIRVVVERNGTPVELQVEPIRDEGAYFPMLGIGSTSRLSLYDPRKVKGTPWVVPGSPAAAAAADGRGFEAGDRIVAMTDPGDPAKATPAPADRAAKPLDTAEYHRRMVLLADRPVTFEVLRKGQPDDAGATAITVAPAYRSDLGLRMQMGKVAALRAGGPAARAGVQAVPLDAPPTGPGDQIAAVGVAGPDGKRTWYANGTRPPEAKPDEAVQPLDPVLLPRVLDRWAAGFPETARKGLRVEVVVLREVNHSTQRVPLVLDYDAAFRFDREVPTTPNSPLPVGGLGLAYWVAAVVDDVAPNSAAAGAGLRAGDPVTAVRFRSAEGEAKDDDWVPIKDNQWATVEAAFQGSPPHRIDLKVKRGDETVEVSLAGAEDKAWAADDRGLVFQPDYRVQRAADVGDAVHLGVRRTWRSIKQVYMNLYAMARGRVSAKTMSGPLAIANVSYKIAGEDVWQFLLFLGMISINLAVVNFLPIPVLDGGHMVFLIYEGVTGRPVPERLFAVAMWVGLALILCLFVFVLYLDVGRLFFGLK